eukprot:TCONS_00068125-protein
MNLLIFVLVINYLFHGSKAASDDDCILSEWGDWGPCSKNCSTGGTKTRSKTIIQMNGFFGDPCSTKTMKESTECGIENNGCEQLCDPQTGHCHCRKGMMPDEANLKSCVDINECNANFGRGDCAQKCENIKEGYKCSCYPNFYLASDEKNCNFNTSAEKCDFAIREYSDTFECVCKDKELVGLKCNKNKDQCSNVKCMSDSVCLLYNHPGVNCFAIKDMIPILHPIKYSTYNIGNYRYIVELYMTRILEKIAPKSPLFGGNYDTNDIHSSDTSKFYYVEGSQPRQVKSFTYVLYAVFNIENSLTSANPQEICSKLSGTDVHCLTQRECNILKSEGFSCPHVYTSTFGKQESNDSSKSNVIVIVVCLVVLLALIAIAICFVRRRGKWRNLRMMFHRDTEEVRQVNDTLLRQESQNEPPPPYTAQDSNLAHIEQFDRSVFKDEPLNKRVEEPVYESVTNLTGLPKYEDEYESMSSVKKGDKVDLPDEEDEGAARYVAVPCPTIAPSSGEAAGQSSSSATEVEPHYVAPTNNKPLLYDDDDVKI